MPDEVRRDDRLIFVGGAPRSGTTMVQNILDNHPNICGGPEFDHVPDIVALRNRLHSSIDSGRIRAFCSVEDIDREIGGFVERLLIPYADKQDCGLVSEKTPWNALVFRDLLEIFPGARFLFCVRDPRAVVASMLEVGKRAQKQGVRSPRFTRNVSAAVNIIKSCNAAGFEAVESSDRVLTVVYERMVVDPDRETKRLCDFLRIPWSAEMLKPGEKKHEGEKVLDGIWYDSKMYNRNLDSSRINGWQNLLTITQRAAVADAFARDKHLRALGYEILEKDLPASKLFAGRAYNIGSSILNSGFYSLLTLARKIVRG